MQTVQGRTQPLADVTSFVKPGVETRSVSTRVPSEGGRAPWNSRSLTGPDDEQFDEQYSDEDALLEDARSADAGSADSFEVSPQMRRTPSPIGFFPAKELINMEECSLRVGFHSVYDRDFLNFSLDSGIEQDDDVSTAASSAPLPAFLSMLGDAEEVNIRTRAVPASFKDAPNGIIGGALDEDMRTPSFPHKINDEAPISSRPSSGMDLTPVPPPSDRARFTGRRNLSSKLSFTSDLSDNSTISDGLAGSAGVSLCRWRRAGR